MWDFISDPANRDTLAWIGGGIAVAISALWTAYLKLGRKTPAKPAPPPPSVSATGGIAAGETVNISGGVNVSNGPGLAWPLTLGALGVAALGYAIFAAPTGDCTVNSVTSGGDIDAGSIVINGGSGEVEC